MSEIKGIYAASLSILDSNLALNVKKTIKHAENLIDQGCHGVAIFGSTGQAQLISISEKIQLINELSDSKYKEKFILGTGLNSLSETINLIKIAISQNFFKFLIMPPAYYKYGDEEVINFYTKIIEKFPDQIIGVKDSSYNLFEKLKIKNFSMLPGSEGKLLKGLEIGCSGIITATCNVTASLARKVYEDFKNEKKQTANEKLCNVRKTFEQFNLISGLHTFLSQKDDSYINILPTLSLLVDKDKKKLFEDLKKLDFNINNLKAE